MKTLAKLALPKVAQTKDLMPSSEFCQCACVSTLCSAHIFGTGNSGGSEATAALAMKSPQGCTVRDVGWSRRAPTHEACWLCLQATTVAQEGMKALAVSRPPPSLETLRL